MTEEVPLPQSNIYIYTQECHYSDYHIPCNVPVELPLLQLSFTDNMPVKQYNNNNKNNNK